mgnify:CR=1 FL=1
MGLFLKGMFVTAYGMPLPKDKNIAPVVKSDNGEKKLCTHCGAVVGLEEKVCKYCGKDLNYIVENSANETDE